MRVSEAQPGLISLDRRVRLPDPLLTADWVRKLEKRPGREPGDSVGSIPTLVTTIPWSNGYDAWVTTRRAMVRLHPGSLWSVSVAAARVRGKDEDRVQVPDGPSTEHACPEGKRAQGESN